MLPTSHLVPIHQGSEPALARAVALADAFSAFSAAAERLEHSYQELQNEVIQMRAVLAERNRALLTSRAEHSQMKSTLRQILDSLPCGVLVVGDGRQVNLSNPEARRLLGVAGEMMSRLDDIPDASRVPVQTALQESRTECGETEYCMPNSTGARWLAVRSRQFSTGAGGSLPDSAEADSHRQTILILRDTTSQKKHEEDREAARNVLALAEMSAVLAHEIRNPLASLELFAGLIGEGGAAPEHVAQLRAGIRSLSATVNNVLLFHGGGAPQLAPVQLDDALHSAAEFVRPLAEQRGIALSLQVEVPGLVIRGDHNTLQQVFLNLALNAFRHTAVGGWLRITAGRIEEPREARGRVEFCDNGCGIEPSLLSRVFEAGCSGNGQTPGLGLAVCRRIVEQHGGTIGVSSEAGRGTTVVLEFPLES